MGRITHLENHSEVARGCGEAATAGVVAGVEGPVPGSVAVQVDPTGELVAVRVGHVPRVHGPGYAREPGPLDPGSLAFGVATISDDQYSEVGGIGSDDEAVHCDGLVRVVRTEVGTEATEHRTRVRGLDLGPGQQHGPRRLVVGRTCAPPHAC